MSSSITRRNELERLYMKDLLRAASQERNTQVKTCLNNAILSIRRAAQLKAQQERRDQQREARIKAELEEAASKLRRRVTSHPQD